MMAHIKSNPLATEYNPSITHRAVANSPHSLKNCGFTQTHVHSHTHTHTITHTHTHSNAYTHAHMCSLIAHIHTNRQQPHIVSRQICRLLYLSGTNAYLFLILPWLEAAA